MIPYGKQDINQADIDAVVDVLTSERLTQGPVVPEFEKKTLTHCQSRFAIASNSATSALHIACLSLGITKGDIVWTSPISFVASANCALYCNADIDFVDIDPVTGNMSVSALALKLKKAKKNNALPSAIIPVHLAGQACDMEVIYLLAQEFGFKIIEDASHAIGGYYQDSPVGSCKFSDITVFSFHPVKIITSAEGGMALTNDKKLAKKMRSYRSHGIVNSEEDFKKETHGPWYYEQQSLGFNYRMTELQAALGVSQLNRLSTFVEKRHQLAQIYDQAFKAENLSSLHQSSDSVSSYHLYILLLPTSKSDLQRKLFEYLRAKEIFVQIHYIPIHLQPYYTKLGFNVGDFPNAEAYYKRAISLPLHPNLQPKEQTYIINNVIEFLYENT
ncbi:UDP-4-amino-4,6-dideoxy-N-acetyl-beta-L-altrosamine transaminase [Colwellia sp. 75C3]|uniref:UDP-4-amino-4, 6-dideoxy-N-acetyl-beta-L-altrosamine transaminase n=1 Tax=Colwellia sp. 75C3 TaxID=888425 RepID=UPI000C329C12|nr:UDP-4-amino-4,6-dideoxy-N-acetyl-beta-L-altrosamine transaminase [Colwellia sp. 75C3]PKG81130.1 UDP-4-amino-4,6-dideoxy-N-acetyl-beta-L-altrosamine transaminase [Colwellia sp. 75C3]